MYLINTFVTISLMKQLCRLCTTSANFFYEDKQRYFRCQCCDAIFTHSDDLIDESDEKERYELHNDQIDEGYKKFVSPITSNILKDFSQDAKGLDFGSGRSEIISKVLQEHQYSIENFDPFFANMPHLLLQKYDYVSSCEVIEHFYNPKKEFELLRTLLKEKGRLYLMTELYDDTINFSTWYYKNDPTHVFFYSIKTIQFIQKKFEFKSVRIDKRVIILTL